MSENKKMIFAAQLVWQPQNQPFTIKEYSRTFIARVEGKTDLIGSSAVEFSGSPYHHNPEDLLVISLASCHMLTYLAHAALGKITVLSYQDNPIGELEKSGGIFKFAKIILRPHIKLSQNSDIEKARALHDKAHHHCFIANSINFPVEIEPEFSQE